MEKLFRFSVYLILGVLFFLSCTKPKMVSEIPLVAFKSVSITNTLDTSGNEVKRIKLTINVIDGDGDIGIAGDNNYIYPGFEDLGNHDCFITLHQKDNGLFDTVSEFKNSPFGIPYLEPEGQDKTLKADIEVTMDIYQQNYNFDTIKFSFFLYDRKRHISNIAESPAIPADTLGLIE